MGVTHGTLLRKQCFEPCSASPIAAPRLHQQVIYRSAMLITPAVSPDERAKDAVQELGVSCRICPKQTCTARREPAIAA